MYNGIGLETPRGSGTNGYTQTNKFPVRPNPMKAERKDFERNQGTGGGVKRANKDILEHDRKRQIELKLIVLEDKLIEQGYTDDEISMKLNEARRESLKEVEEAKKSKVGTETQQIVGRKEKQMEVLREALGVKKVDENV
ncbi:hypothetical protein MKW94_018855 [Papaver nudicaule]|uniref:CWF21 domain-containing protein n=1 Tax=Papaver nudicaule TaxID=74823 RepID=A0AA41V2K1_PAPNU|nr:hypothetical protein [Papaver nudicaule]